MALRSEYLDDYFPSNAEFSKYPYGHFESVSIKRLLALQDEPNGHFLALVLSWLLCYGGGYFECGGTSRQHNVDDGWIPIPLKRLKTEVHQKSKESPSKWIQELCDLSLLQTKRKGLPARLYIKINFEQLRALEYKQRERRYSS